MVLELSIGVVMTRLLIPRILSPSYELDVRPFTKLNHEIMFFLISLKNPSLNAQIFQHDVSY